MTVFVRKFFIANAHSSSNDANEDKEHCTLRRSTELASKLDGGTFARVMQQ